MMKTYDYLIVGAGFFGSICAHELQKAGKRVLVVEKRNHIGGNCFTENIDGINVHKYGPHIFHTSNEKVWKWIGQFCQFNNFRLMPVANYKGELFSLPFNMWTFEKLWGITSPEEAMAKIESQSPKIEKPQNLEEQALSMVGRDVYEKLIKGYTKKQWMKEPHLLPPEIIKRLPVRFTYDGNYFNDRFQGIPVGGYTGIFEKLLLEVEVRLEVDYLASREYFDSLAEKIIYTGPIDRFFDFKYGYLEYKTTKFEHQALGLPNYQGVAMMNFTDEETPHTRIIEHKHFEGMDTPSTIISYEYPVKYNPKASEPYYPVNDSVNNQIYEKYLDISKNLGEKYCFGGRLAEYKYYDMHNVIERALEFCDNL